MGKQSHHRLNQATLRLLSSQFKNCTCSLMLRWECSRAALNRKWARLPGIIWQTADQKQSHVVRKRYHAAVHNQNDADVTGTRVPHLCALWETQTSCACLSIKRLPHTFWREETSPWTWKRRLEDLTETGLIFSCQLHTVETGLKWIWKTDPLDWDEGLFLRVSLV